MKKISAAVVAMLSVASVPAHADGFCPSNYVGTTQIEMDGTFRARLWFSEGQNITICNTREDYPVIVAAYGSKNISPTMCQALMAQFMTAKARHTTVQAFVSGPCPTEFDLHNWYPIAWYFN